MKKLNKKILITGGAGYIGQNLIGFFLKKKYQIYVIDNLSTSVPLNSDIKKNVSFYKIDLGIENKAKFFFKNRNFDLIIHLAALSGVQEFNKNVLKSFNNNVLATKNLVRFAFQKKNTKLIINKRNIGAGFSRNKGINIAKGKYIAFLDCDDLWKKNKLEKQIQFMKKNNSKFCHTNYYLIDENSKFYGLIKVKKVLSYSKLMNSCDIGLSTVLLEKKLLLNRNFPNLKTKEDYALWLELAKSSIKIEGLNLNLAYWRNSKNSLSSSLGQKFFDAFRVYYFYEKKI